MGQIWEQTQTFWFHFLLDVGTFVERLRNVYSFTVLILLPGHLLLPVVEGGGGRHHQEGTPHAVALRHVGQEGQRLRESGGFII
jgi:hypothetical protein